MVLVNSCQKGKRFERTISKFIRDNFGIEARRGQQFCGANGDADVIAFDCLFIEAKGVERLNINEAMAQAVRDCNHQIPSVWHKKNRGKLLITIQAEDLKAFVHMMFDELFPYSAKMLSERPKVEGDWR
jgi:hypothetical protein